MRSLAASAKGTPDAEQAATAFSSNSNEPLDINQAAAKFGWAVNSCSRPADFSGDLKIKEIQIAAIRRPLARSNGTIC
jgi:hypothetical protein